MQPDSILSANRPLGLLAKVKKVLRRLRIWLLLTFKYKFKSVGCDFYMGYGTTIRRNVVSVGDHCYIGNKCHIASHVDMGNYVMVASHVSMIGGDHRFDVIGTPSIHAGRNINKPIVIEDDAWIGHGAIIMHGIRIGEGAIVAAGALVTKDVLPYSIVGSKPAEIIGQRFEGENLKKHKQILTQLRNKG